MSDFYLNFAICLPENLLRACEPVCLRLCLPVLVYVPFFCIKETNLVRTLLTTFILDRTRQKTVKLS